MSSRLIDFDDVTETNGQGKSHFFCPEHAKQGWLALLKYRGLGTRLQATSYKARENRSNKEARVIDCFYYSGVWPRLACLLTLSFFGFDNWVRRDFRCSLGFGFRRISSRRESEWLSSEEEARVQIPEQRLVIELTIGLYVGTVSTSRVKVFSFSLQVKPPLAPMRFIQLSFELQLRKIGRWNNFSFYVILKFCAFNYFETKRYNLVWSQI